MAAAADDNKDQPGDDHGEKTVAVNNLVASAKAARLHAEAAKLQAETDKLRKELEQIEADAQSAKTEAKRGWLITVTGILSGIALVIPAAKGVFEFGQTAQAIALARRAEARQAAAAASEIDARTAATQVAQAAEMRLKLATASEVDVRLLSTYLTEILPRISGVVSYHLSEQCLARRLAANTEPNAAGQQCSGAVPTARAAQIGAYFAAVDLANRYPLLCNATRTALLNQQQDENAQSALRSLRPCVPISSANNPPIPGE